MNLFVGVCQEHWDSNQRIKHSRIYKIKNRNKKNKQRMDIIIMNKEYLENVVELLKELEYAGTYIEPYDSCPMCNAFNNGEEHEHGCKLAELIKQTEGMLK